MNQETEAILYNGKIIRLHDYKKIFSTQGCYEEIFNKILKCNSHIYIVDIMKEYIEENKTYEAIEIGAGNGVFANEVKMNFDNIDITGVDILVESMNAAERDYKGVYKKYIINYDILNNNKKYDIVFCVSSLGLGHVSASEFENYLQLIKPAGLLIMNIRDFLFFDSEFKKIIEKYISSGIMNIKHKSLYFHRFSVMMEPINYYCFIMRNNGE